MLSFHVDPQVESCLSSALRLLGHPFNNWGTSIIVFKPATSSNESLIKSLTSSASNIKMPSLSQFYLPEMLPEWPWPRKLNQHYQETKYESDKWVYDLEVLDADEQKSFDSVNSGEHWHSFC
jgi:hypothetical protein